MTKYKVKGFKIAQTKEGKDYKRVDLVDSTGAVYTGVPYWSSLPGYAEVVEGSYIEGSITTTQNGAYTNHKLSLANMPQKSGGPMAGVMKAKSEAINQAQDKKAELISKSQERNEVMYAKKSAAELIAHHPAYKGLNDLNLPHAFQNLTKMILNFNPNTSFTAREVDDHMEHVASFNRAIESDEINAEDVPF